MSVYYTQYLTFLNMCNISLKLSKPTITYCGNKFCSLSELNYNEIVLSILSL